MIQKGFFLYFEGETLTHLNNMLLFDDDDDHHHHHVSLCRGFSFPASNNLEFCHVCKL